MPEVYLGNLASSVISADLLGHLSRARVLAAPWQLPSASQGSAEFGSVEMVEMAEISDGGRRAQPFEQQRAERTPNQDRS